MLFVFKAPEFVSHKGAFFVRQYFNVFAVGEYTHLF